MTAFNNFTGNNIQNDLYNVFAASSPIRSTSVIPRWQRISGMAMTGSPARKSPTASPKTKKACSLNMNNGGDRYISSRAAMDTDLSAHCLQREADDDSCRILAFRGIAPSPKKSFNPLYTQSSIRSSTQHYDRYSNNPFTASPKCSNKKNTSNRYIPSQPEKVLDAPSILDDYYLNLLDWSTQNTLAVALANSLYLWNGNNGSVSELLSLPDQEYISSIAFSADGAHLSVGTSNAAIQIWDVNTGKKLRTLVGHRSRVSSLSWNGAVLSSGSRDGAIFNSDVRNAQHHTSTFLGHAGEVCGLKWSPDGSLLASGGNDNFLNIWDPSSVADISSLSESPLPLHTFSQHLAAVKALAWCPWQPKVIASGGGSSDRSIKFWDCTYGSLLSSTDAGSQVCSLLWNSEHRELISSHGFADNQLSVWKYPSMTKVTDLKGHSARVLFMAQSPDGQTVVSGAADETLKFWRIWESSNKDIISSNASGLVGKIDTLKKTKIPLSTTKKSIR